MLGIPYTIQEIAQAGLARDLFQGRAEITPVREVAFDTRLISKGAETLFVAIKSPHRDGHAYVRQAYEQGVRYFLTEQKLPYPDIGYALCDNTLESLQAWAAAHRMRFDYPVVGITGSNGKTIVKEWLATLLEWFMPVVKSPMSYNSQLGVAISLLNLHPQARLALIEAGISRAGEMDLLAEMIRPQIGILTHMGDAHADGFHSFADKLQEKLKLFAQAEVILCGDWQPAVTTILDQQGYKVRYVGTAARCDLRILQHTRRDDTQHLTLAWDNETYSLDLPLAGQAHLENALLAVLAALHLGMSWDAVQERVALLTPVEMRTEMITDNPEITIINDSYNSDPDAIRNALHLLVSTQRHPRRWLILSDILHQGDRQEAVQRDILHQAASMIGAGQIITVGPVFGRMGHPHHYPDTDALLRSIRYPDFVDSTVLLKGARAFGLERVIPLLNRKLNATRFQINLQALTDNLRALTAGLPEGIRTMCMVKAASYGSGTWEIAQALEKAGVTYLAVAYASEGIELRQAGIRLPIMVMNPDPGSLETLVQFAIEPEISNPDLLHRFVRTARLAGAGPCRIHLKLETGMGRLGFTHSELPEVMTVISRHPDIEVVSVMSHLAAADDPAEDVFTLGQIHQFQAMYQVLADGLGIQPWRHILNTAGVLRFPAYAMDMVRLGVGLYGINPVAGLDTPLQEIGSLFATITQIHTWEAGVSIGYGRSQLTQRRTQVATIPIGYADGIPRAVGNGRVSFGVRGYPAPTIGRICMDMLMLDVTDIPDVRPGDEVLIFGQQGEHRISVTQLATAADTIPYEILVRISPRVRRVYVRE